MQAAHMSFEEEVLKLREEAKKLRQENAQLKNNKEFLRKKVGRLEKKSKEQEEGLERIEQELTISEEKRKYLEEQIETLQLIIEELRIKVFGKKRNGSDKPSNDDSNTAKNSGKKRAKANRTKESYRRAAPKDEEVTETIPYPLSDCPDCGTRLTLLKEVIRFIEDCIDITTFAKVLKRVIKQIITTGYCANCKKRKTAIAISPQISTLGENIKKFIVYEITLMKKSFEDTRRFIRDMMGIEISDGEIVSALDQQAEKHKPEHERIVAKVRGSPGRHYDETIWKTTAGQGNYCWVTTPTEGEEAVFLCGRSRGKGNAEELQGNVDNQTGITDDYAVYDNLFKDHQLCWGHPKRKLRDLKDSKEITGERKKSCLQTYEDFSNLYAEVEEVRVSEYDKQVWDKKKKGFYERFIAITELTPNDPKKLITIKNTLKERAEYYFTCLSKPGIPSDNNKAERKIRHIALKRKISFGSKSQKGADTMSILFTTMLSCWWNRPQNFFVAYNQMLTA